MMPDVHGVVSSPSSTLNSGSHPGAGTMAPPRSPAAAHPAEASPMKVAPYFCPADTDPFDTVEWDYRTAAIKDENGQVLFEQANCEVPKTWSAPASNCFFQAWIRVGWTPY